MGTNATSFTDEINNFSAKFAEMQAVCSLPPMPDLYNTNPSCFQSPRESEFIIPDTPTKNFVTPRKNGPGQPKGQDYSEDFAIGAVMQSPSSGCVTPVEVRKKRKYTRREKSDPVRCISEITELTEHVASLLDSTIRGKEQSVHFGDLNFRDLENSNWKPYKIGPATESSTAEENDSEDVADFNSLIKEWLDETVMINEGAEGKEVDASKRSTRTAPRTNVLNCRRKAISSLAGENGKDSRHFDPGNSGKEYEQSTWNYRIGGKCSNKWQLFEKHVLENNVRRELRERRLTDRLIKVLSSTPQRKLRSTTTVKTLNGESPDDTDTNTPAETSPLDKIATDEKLHADSPHSEKPVVGGYCPDIEPSLIIWPGSCARSLVFCQNRNFQDSSSVDPMNINQSAVVWHPAWYS